MKSIFQKSLLPLLTSLCVILSFPLAWNSPNVIPGWISGIVVFFAWVPLIFFLREASPKASFGWAYLSGFLYHGGTLFWVFVAIRKYGGLSIGLSGFILLALLWLMAFFPAFVFWFLARWRKMAPPWLLGTLIFSLMEWARNFIPFGGFPWISPAYALWEAHAFIQSADLWGIMGINFLIFLCNFVLAESFFQIRKHGRVPRWGIAIFLGFFLFSWMYGLWRIPNLQSKETSQPSLKAALIQGNIPQDQKWMGKEKKNILGTYHRLSKETLAFKPDLIIWPEASFPWTLPKNVQWVASIPSDLLEEASLILGVPTYHYQDRRLRLQNSALWISSQGFVKGRYDKRHLVPFGEYVPLDDVLPVHKIVPSVAGNFSKGEETSLFEIQHHPFGLLICYELLFPELSLQAVEQGAQFLVNITNDAWFDRTSGPFQHAHFGIFRAIETRRPILRVANTGITTWFDFTGKFYEPTSLFEEATKVVTFHPSTVSSLYGFCPLALPCLSLLVLFVCFWIHVRKEEKNG